MKNPIQSKTLWLNLLVALITALVPVAQDWIAQHPAWSSNLLAVANVVLRMLTTEPVSMKGDSMTVKISK